MRHTVVRHVREAGVSDGVVTDLQLALSEAVSNAVLHAFRTRSTQGTIWVSVAVTPQTVDVVVRDDGIGLRPRDDSPGLGFGLSLIERMADETEHRTPEDGVGFELWMRFRR